MALVDRLEDILYEIDMKRLSTYRRQIAIRKLRRLIEDVEDGTYSITELDD
jgi:hypothetical protein